ncbi:hypothetical protein [Cohnella hongkongensis]|uniref:Uncharacterized protein n=1 Tax=Cohnella hongkongensis TaxID=178337 RepID=A0ABV9FEE1_9BACL
MGAIRNKAVWMYIALITSLPGVYVFHAGNGFAKLFVVSPVLFLVTAIV